jgi:FMN phosphatase YigB (HAD superfamily)
MQKIHIVRLKDPQGKQTVRNFTNYIDAYDMFSEVLDLLESKGKKLCNITNSGKTVCAETNDGFFIDIFSATPYATLYVE